MERQPSDPNIFPKMALSTRLERLGDLVCGCFSFLPSKPLASHGDTLPIALRDTQQDNQLTLDL